MAPDREVSACSQSLTLKHPLRAEKVDARVYAVDGTPADCVNLAIVKLLPRRPALVASGINRGGNLGDDVFYSGTVGGAREGTFFGVPSIAISLAARADFDYAPAAASRGRSRPSSSSAAFPSARCSTSTCPRAGRRASPSRCRADARTRARSSRASTRARRTYYWIEEGRDEWVSDEMSDIFAVRSGLVSVSPLQTDTTNHRQIPALPRVGEGPSQPRRLGSWAAAVI